MAQGGEEEKKEPSREKGEKGLWDEEGGGRRSRGRRRRVFMAGMAESQGHEGPGPGAGRGSGQWSRWHSGRGPTEKPPGTGPRPGPSGPILVWAR